MNARTRLRLAGDALLQAGEPTTYPLDVRLCAALRMLVGRGKIRYNTEEEYVRPN